MVFFKAQKMQRLADLLQRVQGQIEREGGEATTIEEDLRDVARRLGVDREVVRLADAETLVGVLASGGSPAPGKCWATAELLFMEALLLRARGRSEEAGPFLAKARRLYLLLGDGLELPAGAPEPEERLARIGAWIGEGREGAGGRG